MMKSKRRPTIRQRDPFLDVIGIGGNGRLTQNIDESLYGQFRGVMPELLSHASKRRKLRIVTPAVWFQLTDDGVKVQDRWPWEETGRINVMALPGVDEKARVDVVRTVNNLLQEFRLPLRVSGLTAGGLYRRIITLVDRATEANVVDDEKLLERLNSARKDEPRLQRGLVLLFDPQKIKHLGNLERSNWASLDQAMLTGFAC